MSAPTLHEIAAMPFPASLEAVRKHYDPKWGLDQPDGPGKFRVRFEWTISGFFDEEIEAESAEEAEEIARERAADDARTGDFEVEGRVKIDAVQHDPL